MFDPGMTQNLKDISTLDLSVHTPARLMTLYLLFSANTLDFIQLMTLTGLTWGNLSTHLTKLEEVGYVMITKTFKGKRPHTLISLTETGRQAYLQWGNTIIKALPSTIVQDWIPAYAGMTGKTTQQKTDLNEMQLYAGSDISSVQNRDVFFLPKYHRWGMDLPPIKDFNQLS
jgi:DNA-binding MarR family transcriptional regulator